MKIPKWAIEKAAQAWCKKNTKKKVLDTDLTIEFAKILYNEIRKTRRKYYLLNKKTTLVYEDLTCNCTDYTVYENEDKFV
jgi:hypothetical protein